MSSEAWSGVETEWPDVPGRSKNWSAPEMMTPPGVIVPLIKVDGRVNRTPERVKVGVMVPAMNTGGRVNKTPSMTFVGVTVPAMNAGGRENRTPLRVCAPVTGENRVGVSL